MRYTPGMAEHTTSRIVRRALVAGLSLAALAGVACKPPPITPGVPAADPPPVTVPQVPEARPLVVGDSISWQVLNGGAWPAGWDHHMAPGWKADTVQPLVGQRAAANTLDELVIMLGTNDANPVWNGGWTAQDEARWLQLVHTPAAGVCVAIVLPWLAPTTPDQAHVAEIAEARTFITALAATRPGTVLVDWATWAQQPGVLDADGIHLAAGVDLEHPTELAMQARIDAATAALEGCPS